MTQFSQLNPSRAKIFLRHIVHVINRNMEKEEAKHTLVERVQNLKKYLRSKSYRKAKVATELDILQKQIESAIEKGAKVTTYRPSKGSISSFQKKIEALEKAIDAYVSTYHKREQKILDLEKKIINEANAEPESKSEHLKKLEDLEKKFLEMENLNHFDIEQLSRIRVKIEFLKNKAKDPSPSQ
jgi:seryl-tRNA synthetase